MSNKFHFRSTLLAIVALLAIANLSRCQEVAAATAAQGDDFADVRQLLKAKCLSCHGPDKQEGSLRIDSPEALLAGGDRGAAMAVSAPQESLLVHAVSGKSDDLLMPPDKNERLTEEEIERVKSWIAAGAPWDVDSAPSEPPRLEEGRRYGDAWSDPENPVTRVFAGKRLDLWSLRPVERWAPPVIVDGGARMTDIDRFIVAKLAERGLTLAPEADRRTLIRRLTYDLTGLPPAPEDVETFIGDDSPNAYEALVDRLLASPRYGERMARRWLDVVRYADTEGFERDEFRPTIYRYRDYVIRSFQNDKPYDLFLREQLCGDEMVAGQPIDEAAAERLVATGFLRLGPRDTTAEIFEENERSRDQWLGDLANTTGEAFLGLTMSCCQCHDHKFDPLLQTDHFRLRAFFASLQMEDEKAIDTDAARQEIEKHNADIEAQAKPLREARDSLLAQGQAAARIANNLAADAEVSASDAEAAMADGQRERCVQLTKQLEEIEKRKRDFTTGWCASDAPGEAPAVHVFFQGDIHQPKEATSPGFLSIFDPNPATIAKPASSTTSGRRSALADWIASPANPLTARVMVNRLWAHLFGVGLVATPNDFGYSGAAPTHPELLDYLASEFVAGGWSVKKLQRAIVLSAVYRQESRASAASEHAQRIDRENQLLWRQNPRRLDAESLRDALLFVSGTLLPVNSGPPRWPAIPEFVRASNPATLDDNGRLQNWYTTTPEEDTFVRTIFIVQKRSIPTPFLQPFDAPDSTRSCARRETTIVAPQASTLMNSPFALSMAEGLADRVIKEGAEPAEQIRAAFRRALLRDPRPEELQAAADLLARHANDYRSAGREAFHRDALVDLCRALYNANEFMYVD